MLLSVLFACCMEEEDTKQVDQPVSFCLMETRAASLSEFSEGDVIGVYAVDKRTNDRLLPTGNAADNKKYIWKNEKKVFVAADNDNIIFNSPDQELEFYAYYPYQPQVTNAKSISYTVTGTGKEDDILTGIGHLKSGENKVELLFKHLLAKVEVKLPVMENAENAEMSVYTYIDVRFSVVGGVTSPGIRSFVPLEKNAYEDHLTFVGVVPPQTWEVGEKFATLSYKGGITQPFSFSESRRFSSGYTNEVLFMSKEPAYLFSVAPENVSVGPELNSDAAQFTVISQKCEAINGVNLPNTTVPIGYALQSKPDWIDIYDDRLSIADNKGEARNGFVIFVQNESDITDSIAVSQASVDIVKEYTFTLSNGMSGITLKVPSLANSMTVSIISNKVVTINGVVEQPVEMEYSASSDVSWITVSGNILTISGNKDSSSRSGVVTFTQKESEKIIRVAITQDAVRITKTYNLTFDDGSTSISWSNISSSGGSRSVKFISTVDIYLNGIFDRTEVVPMSTSNINVSWAILKTGYLIVAANSTDSPRSGVVTITQRGSLKKIEILMSQQGVSIAETYHFTLDNGSTSASWSSISSSGDSRSYTINSYKEIYLNGVFNREEMVSFTGTANVSWVRINGSTVTVEENPTASPRGGVVTFKQQGSGETIKITLLQLKKSSIEIQ